MNVGSRPVSVTRPAVRWLAATLTVALLAATGCGDDSSRHGAGGDVGGSLLVFGAASLTDAFTTLAEAFETANPDTDVQLNLAGSATLREQIRAGAPADVFAPADRDDLDQLVDAGLVVAPPTIVATNRLQIAIPADNPGGVTGVGDLGDPELLIGLCARGVPCGDLAREALAATGVDPSLDTNEPDVRALLTKLAAGELDAGIVYVTDVLAAGGEVAGIELPDAAAAVTATYAIAALADAGNPATADAFVAFVAGSAGQAILAEHGFGPP